MFVLECYSKPQVRGTMSPDTETAAARISGRGLAGPVLRRRAVEITGAFFKRADHAADRCAEQNLDQPLQQMRLELEIDKEAHPAASRIGCKSPMVVEIAERSLGIGDIDAARRVERDPRREALAEHPKPDDQVGDDQVGAAFLDARRCTTAGIRDN